MQMDSLFGRKSAGRKPSVARKHKAIRRRHKHSVVVTEKLEDRTLMSVTNPVDAVNDFDNNPADENNFPAGADIYVIENLTVNAQANSAINLDLDAANGGLGNLNAVIIRNLTITNNTGLVGVNVVLSNMNGANALDNLIIENLTITGNAGPGLNIYLDNTVLNGLTIRNSTISSNTAGGIGIIGVNGSLISNVDIKNNTISNNTAGDGILYKMDNASLTNGLSISNNTAINGNAGHGVNFVLDNGSNVTGLILDANTIQSNTAGSGVFFDQANSDVAGSIKNNTISNHAAGYGIAFIPTATTGNSEIDLAEFTGNTITGNGLGGVKVDVPVQTTFDARVENNDINNNNGIGFELTVIDTNDAVDLVIGGSTAAQGNRINGNRGAGIAINLNDTRGNNTGPDRTAATVKILNNTINSTRDTLVADANYNGEGIKFRLFGTNVLTNGTARLFDTIVDKNTINASASHAIDIDASEDSIIEGLMIGNITGSNFGNNNDGNTLTNSAGSGNGVNLLRRDHSVIDNLRIVDNTITGNSVGVKLTARNNYDVSEILIQDNTISSNRAQGVHMHNEDDAVMNVDVVGNTISSNAADGILTTAAENDGNDQEHLTGTWYKNTITNNGGDGMDLNSIMTSPVGDKYVTLGKDGIDVDGRDMGNTITGNSGWGIVVNSFGKIIIRGSDIKTNGQGGLDINGGSKTVDIVNNEISQNTGKGIDIDNNTTNAIVNINLIQNIVTFNTDDGLEIMNSAQLFFGAGMFLNAIRNTIDLNGGRGVDILNAGNGDAHLTFGDGTLANHNNIRSNNREGVYVVNSADVNQTQDSTSTALSSEGDLDVRPNLVFELDFNEIKQNGFGSGLSGTGLVMRVGTANRGDDGSGTAFAYNDAPDTTGDAFPFSDEWDVGVGSNGVQSFLGNGRVNARVENNQFDGNAGVDVFVESYRSTIQVPVTGGTWSDPGNVLTFDPQNYSRDPLARLNLVFTGNTGDSLDVNRPGASYSSADPFFKSRTNNYINGNVADDPDPFNGPFDNGSRNRNAQRVGADRAVDDQTFFYDGLGASTFRVETDATNFFSNGDDFSNTFNNGLGTDGNPGVSTSYDWVNVAAGTVDTESLTINDIVVNESAGTATFTVTLSDPATHDVVFSYRTRSESATVGFGAPVPIENATFTTNDIIINSSGHNLATGDLITISGVAGNTAANGTHSVIVINDDRFILKGVKGNGVYVAGTGTWVPVNADYTFSSGTITFTPGQTVKTIDVPIFNDTLDEIDEKLFVTITATAGGIDPLSRANVVDAIGIATITDDDATPTLSINDISQNEGTGGQTEYNFTVTLSAASEKIVTVDFATSDGTALEPGDYRSQFGTLIFNPGETTKSVKVLVEADDDPEADETFNVTLSNAVNAGITDASGLGTLVNDDATITPQISINDRLTIVEGDSGSHTEVFLLSLDQASTLPVTVTVTTANGVVFDQSALAGLDYQATTQTVTFAPGQTTQAVQVTILADTVDEFNESFFLNLSSPVNATIADAQGQGTIIDDDATVATISINDVTQTEVDAGTQDYVFTVTLSTPSGKTVTVDYATADGNVVDAMATTSDGDYNSKTGTVTFNPGETSKTITIQVVGDLRDEFDEDFFVNLTNAVNSAGISDAQGVGRILDNDAPPIVTINDLSIVEGDAGSQNLVFTVNLSQPSGKVVSVDYQTVASGLAQAGFDYTTTTGTLTFTPGNSFGAGTTQLTVTVPILGDLIDEFDETFDVQLLNPVNSTISGTDGVGTGTIIDNDEPPVVSINSVNIVEGDAGTQDLVFTVSLTQPSNKVVTIDYQTAAPALAEAGIDFTTTTGTLTFTPGNVFGATTTELTISVPIVGDLIDEFDETFTVTLLNPVNTTLDPLATVGTGTIIDNDEPPVVSINSVNIVEGDAGTQDLVFTVSLTQPSNKVVTIDYQTAAITALANIDYTESNGTLTFTPGNVFGVGTTQLTVSIPIIGDNVYEFDDTFKVTLLNPVNVTIDPVLGEGIGTILDNEAPPTISITSPSSLEGSDPLNPNDMVFTVTLSHPSERPVSVDYDTTQGDVTSGGSSVTAIDVFLLLDDTGSFSGVGPSLIAGFPGIVSDLEAALPGFSLAFGIGRFEDYDGTDQPFILNQPIVVSSDPNFDAAINGALGRSAPGGGGDLPESTIEALYQVATGAGYDGNNDGDTTDNGAAGLVSTQTSFGVGDDVPAFSTYTPDPTGPTILPSGNIGGVGYRPGALHLVLLATDIGFAYQPDGLANYTGSGFTVPAVNLTSGGRGTTPFGTGASIQETIDALIANGIEVIGLGTNAAAGSQPRRGLEALALLTGSINETSAPIDSGIVGDPINPGEALYFQINASAPDNIAAAIVAAVAGSIGNIGAAAGLDFTEADGTLNFTPGYLPGAGTTVLEIHIPIEPDLIDENDENFTVTLLNPVNGTLDSNATVGTATIIDDDDPPEISIDDINVLEGGVAQFTVSLNIESGKQVTVQFVTEDGTALVPNDYQSTSGLVIFAPGETTKTVSVNINTDGLDEFDENFFVRLQNPTDGTIIDDLGEGTIIDIDPLAKVSIGDFTVVREGDTGTKTATFLITLDTPSAKPISIDYETANNTAVAGLDYVTKTGTVDFAPGETSKSITVTTLTDVLSEYDEIFNVNLLNPVNVAIDDGQGTAVITDDDPLVTLKINDVSINEGNVGDTVFSFTVSLSRDSGRTITVDYATQNGSALAANGDYDAQTGTLTFNPGDTTKTIDIVVHGDFKHEANETFFVKLTNLVDANFSDDLGQAIIVNDDAIPSITIDDVTHTEGDAGFQNYVFTVSLSNPSGQNVSVDYFTVDFPPLNGTAKPGLDYTPAVGTLNFAEGETTKTITVQVVGDLKNEINENFFVQLSNVQNATLADSMGEGLIIDNDAVPSLTITDKRVAERDGGTRAGVFEVRLSAASGKTVTVDYGTLQTADAVSGADYLPINGTLTFLEGETVKEIFVQVVGDLLNEFDETYTVRLSNAMNATIADADGLGTIVDNDPVPTVTINDVTVAPDAVNAVLQATFTVKLSQISGKPISIDYQTQNGSATAGSDYMTKTGTLTFNPGVLTQTVTINVAGLTFNEFDETFFVNLFNSVNVGILDGQGQGTIQGDTLQVNGTGGDDIFNLQLAAPAAANHALTINGVSQNIAANRYRFLNLNGMAGNDTLFLNGTSRDETAVLDPGGILFKNSAVTVNGLSFSTIDVTGGGGNDTADLKDSAGDDVFTGTPTLANLVGTGFNNTVRGFSMVQGLAYAGGFDIANLLDSAGNDRFVGRDVRSQMTGTGFYNSVSRFEQVNAFSDAGGFDIATLYGSPGDDTLVSRPDRTSLKGTGFENIANRFDNVIAYGAPGGNDTATIFDSAGNDRYTGTPNAGVMAGFVTLGGPAYLNQAIDFKVLDVIASTGHDEADMKNIKTLDTVFGQGSEFTLTRSVQKDKLTGFDVITARADAGQTPTATMNAIDYAFIKVGTWL